MDFETGLAVVQDERDRLKARCERLEKALEDCIETSEEGWAYADGYYKDKWDYKGKIARARAALADEKETPQWPGKLPLRRQRRSPCRTRLT